MCPEAKAWFRLLIYNPVSTVTFLYTLEPGYAQKAKANFNLLETRWSCCGFYITFNFSRLIFYSNAFFPQISCRCLSVWRFHFAAVKVPKKRQAREREKSGKEERRRQKRNVPLPSTRVDRAIVRVWGLDTPFVLLLLLLLLLAACVFNLNLHASLSVGQRRRNATPLVKFSMTIRELF